MEAKLPTIWTDGNLQPGRSSDMERKSEGRRSEVEKMRKGESQKREDAGAQRKR